jgi:regulator of CtrA degradation
MSDEKPPQKLEPGKRRTNMDAVREAVTDFTTSELFQRTFDDGMALVEETAAYLDGLGREESKDLPRRGALAYAGESMRVTTRLMQVASWLLVQRAVREEEMTPEEASQAKYRLSAQEVCRARALDGIELIPARLQDLLERSGALYDRVERLDDQLYRAGRPANTACGVQAQHDALAAAFGTRGK